MVQSTTRRPFGLSVFRSASRLFVIIGLVLTMLLAQPRTAAAAACSFTQGFQTLHNLIPTIVGNCQNSVTYNPATGNALQLTTNGLLVWQKADNLTAFTNGHRTWIVGPFGLQVRLNTQHFPGEAAAIPATIAPQLGSSYRLADSGSFTPLINNVVSQKIPVRLASLSYAFGDFSINTLTGPESIDVDQSLVNADPADAAAVLIHEATHAWDFLHLAGFRTPAGCYQTELNAKQNELQFWSGHFGPAGKPKPRNQFELVENNELSLASSNLQAFEQNTLSTYRNECGL